MNVPNFASAELGFKFASDSGDVWFPIRSFSQPPADSLLAVWDTTAITDGDYQLRLRVFLQDGSFQDVIVAGLKIRNDTPDPTATPTGLPTATPPLLPPPQFSLGTAPPQPSGEAAPTPELVVPSPTPMPPNPAALTVASILSIFGKSAFAVLMLFAFFSLLLRLRKN
jgi:hypothetical protein